MVDPEVEQAWRRWTAAERIGAEEEADRAFRELVRLVPRPPADPGFCARVQAAVAAEAARARVRRWWIYRLLPVASATAVVGLGYLGVTALAPLVVRGAVWAIQLATDLVVWMLLAAAGGWDAWTILGRLGRALTSALVSPRVAFVLLGVELVGAAALYALARLLRTDKESVPW